MRKHVIPENDFNMGAVVDTYGSLDDFAIHLSQSYKNSKRTKFLKAVRVLIQAKSFERSARLNQRKIDLLSEDIELMTYFQSVGKNGEDCWKDEESRVRKQMLLRCPKKPISLHKLRKQTFDGAQNLSLEAINDLLETWRSWGRLLLLYRA